MIFRSTTKFLYRNNITEKEIYDIIYVIRIKLKVQNLKVVHTVYGKLFLSAK